MQHVIKKWIDRYLGSEEKLFLALFFVLALVVVVQFGHVLAPVIAALILSFVLQGFINLLTRRGLSDRLAFWGVYLLFVALFLAVLFVLVPLLGKQSSRLLAETPGMITGLKEALVAIPEKYPQIISQQQFSEMWTRIAADFTGAVQGIFSFSLARVPDMLALLVYLVLVPLMVFFMLKDRVELLAFAESLLPKNRVALDSILREMNLQIANYIRGKAVEILVVGVCSYLAFAIIGLDFAALLGLLVGLSVLIPYIGATVVTIPVAMVAYFQFGFGSDFFLLMGVYGVIQFLDGNLLVPLLFSEAVNLHPLSIILSVLIFGGLWGFWGVFFAIPLATLVKAIYTAWPRNNPAIATPDALGASPSETSTLAIDDAKD